MKPTRSAANVRHQLSRISSNERPSAFDPRLSSARSTGIAKRPGNEQPDEWKKERDEREREANAEKDRDPDDGVEAAKAGAKRLGSRCLAPDVEPACRPELSADDDQIRDHREKASDRLGGHIARLVEQPDVVADEIGSAVRVVRANLGDAIEGEERRDERHGESDDRRNPRQGPEIPEIQIESGVQSLPHSHRPQRSSLHARQRTYTRRGYATRRPISLRA